MVLPTISWRLRPGRPTPRARPQKPALRSTFYVWKLTPSRRASTNCRADVPAEANKMMRSAGLPLFGNSPMTPRVNTLSRQLRSWSRTSSRTLRTTVSSRTARNLRRWVQSASKQRRRCGRTWSTTTRASAWTPTATRSTWTELSKERRMIKHERKLSESWSEPPLRRRVVALTQKPKSIRYQLSSWNSVVSWCANGWFQRWTDGAHEQWRQIGEKIQGALQRALFDQFRGANAASSARAWG